QDRCRISCSGRTADFGPIWAILRCIRSMHPERLFYCSSFSLWPFFARQWGLPSPTLIWGKPPDRFSADDSYRDRSGGEVELCGTHFGFLSAAAWAAWPAGGFQVGLPILSAKLFRGEPW